MQATAPDILLEASYCIYIKRTAAAFAVSDSTTDEKVEFSHPKKESIRSYCGIPLVDGYGNVVGSACHYDTEPKAIASSDVELLEMFSRMVPSGLYRS